MPRITIDGVSRMRVSVAVPTELHPTRKRVMAVMILPACTARFYIYIRSIYLMRWMSAAGFRGGECSGLMGQRAKIIRVEGDGCQCATMSPEIAFQHYLVTLIAWNRRFTVDLSGVRPQHWKSEFLSMLSCARRQTPNNSMQPTALLSWVVRLEGVTHE